MSGAIKPILGSDLFTLKGEFQALKQTVGSDLVGQHSYWYTPLYLEGILKLKSLTLSYSHQFVSSELIGVSLRDDENSSIFKASYRYKNIKFSSGIYWVGQSSKYHSKTLKGSLVDQTSDNRIWDNKNMFVFGFSWNFHKGKSYNVNRKLHNRGIDSATF